MVNKHPKFLWPATNEKLWRYVDITKFLELLNSKSLFFSRADFFNDSFEGSFTAGTIKHREEYMLNYFRTDWKPERERLEEAAKSKKSMAINCWHMNEHESAAMWDLYSRQDTGIAIQTTFTRLYEVLNKSDYKVFMGKVDYIDYDKDLFDWSNGFVPFLNKRKSFQHENELRCIIWKLDGDKVHEINDGIKVHVDVNILIERIYVSPKSKLWFSDLIQDICKKFGYSFSVINSRLDDKPLF